MKRARMNAAAGLEARADQGEVWEEVAARGEELGAASPTGAMSDIYESRREQLTEIREGVNRRDGQCGAVAVIGGKIEMLDFVGRPDVYAMLHDAIVEGYALDALAVAQRVEVSDPASGEAVSESTIRGFTLLACDARSDSASTGIGIGKTHRFDANGVEGTALVAEGEMIQMTAFPSDGSDEGLPSGTRTRRITRPSRRR